MFAKLVLSNFFFKVVKKRGKNNLPSKFCNHAHLLVCSKDLKIMYLVLKFVEPKCSR